MAADLTPLLDRLAITAAAQAILNTRRPPSPWRGTWGMQSASTQDAYRAEARAALEAAGAVMQERADA